MQTEPKYYADGEDAFAMRRDLVVWAAAQGIKPAHPPTFFHKASGPSTEAPPSPALPLAPNNPTTA